MTMCNTCGLFNEDCVCYEEEVEMTEVYVLVDGPAYRKSLASQPDWMLLFGYSPMGTEQHQAEGWEYIDGVCCEVFRHPYGGLIAQPTKVVEQAVAAPVPLELAA